MKGIIGFTERSTHYFIGGRVFLRAFPVPGGVHFHFTAANLSFVRRMEMSGEGKFTPYGYLNHTPTVEDGCRLTLLHTHNYSFRALFDETMLKAPLEMQVAAILVDGLTQEERLEIAYDPGAYIKHDLISYREFFDVGSALEPYARWLDLFGGGTIFRRHQITKLVRKGGRNA